MGWFSRQMARSKQYAEEHKLDVSFEGWRISGDDLYCSSRHHRGQWDISWVHAEVINGPASSSINLPAAALGGVIFGPVGAIIGGSAKIDRTRCYLLVTLHDGQVISDDFPAAKFPQAVSFAGQINRIAAAVARKRGR